LAKEYKSVQRVAQLLLEVIKEGIAGGFFKKDIDPYLMRSMLLGTIEHLAIRHRLIGTPADITVYLDPLVELILDGARVKPEGMNYNINLHLAEDKISAGSLKKIRK